MIRFAASTTLILLGALATGPSAFAQCASSWQICHSMAPTYATPSAPVYQQPEAAQPSYQQPQIAVSPEGTPMGVVVPFGGGYNVVVSPNGQPMGVSQ